MTPSELEAKFQACLEKVERQMEDAQAKTAVKNRMKAIAEGTRG